MTTVLTLHTHLKYKMLVFLSLDVNECLRDVCTFPSLCRNTVGGYACDCPDGYEMKGRRRSGSCEGEKNRKKSRRDGVCVPPESPTRLKNIVTYFIPFGDGKIKR